MISDNPAADTSGPAQHIRIVLPREPGDTSITTRDTRHCIIRDSVHVDRGGPWLVGVAEVTDTDRGILTAAYGLDVAAEVWWSAVDLSGLRLRGDCGTAPTPLAAVYSCLLSCRRHDLPDGVGPVAWPDDVIRTGFGPPPAPGANVDPPDATETIRFAQILGVAV